MKLFDVMKEIQIPDGTVLRLSENQSASQFSALEAMGTPGWFKVIGPVFFRRGESLCFQEMPDTITLQALAPWQTWPEPRADAPGLIPLAQVVRTSASRSYDEIGEVLTYRVCLPTFIPAGVLLGLSEAQAQVRLLNLEPCTQPGWYRAIRELCFKRGEILQLSAVPKRLLPTLEKIIASAPQEDIPVASTVRAEGKVALAPTTGTAVGDSGETVTGLSSRQRKAWEILQKEGALRMYQLEVVCPGLHRRTLHRELKKMVAKGLVRVTGRNRHAIYRLTGCS